MSAALVRKSLALIDDDLKEANTTAINKKRKRYAAVNVPEHQRLTAKIEKTGHKAKKINVLTRSNKISITELVKERKLKENILTENLKKLKKLQRICTIDLDKEVTRQLIERAVTKRPVKLRKKTKVSKKTAFTEEDFKKFEEEYFDE